MSIDDGSVGQRCNHTRHVHSANKKYIYRRNAFVVILHFIYIFSTLCPSLLVPVFCSSFLFFIFCLFVVFSTQKCRSSRKSRKNVCPLFRVWCSDVTRANSSRRSSSSSGNSNGDGDDDSNSGNSSRSHDAIYRHFVNEVNVSTQWMDK